MEVYDMTEVIVQDDVKVVKPPDLIFLQFDDDNLLTIYWERARNLPPITAGQRALEARAESLQLRVLRLARQLKAIRIAIKPILEIISRQESVGYIPEDAPIPYAVLFALRDALEGQLEAGAEEVGDEI
jgi:hypothetical protein